MPTEAPDSRGVPGRGIYIRGVRHPVGLAKDRLVPCLKNVSDVVVFTVIIPAVSAEDALHYAADRLRLAFEQQVNVVRHQAERVDEEWRAGFLLGDKCEKPKSILVSMENILPVISAGNNMIKAALNLDPKLPRHMCEMISGINEYRRIADPTPGFFYSPREGEDFSDAVSRFFKKDCNSDELK